MCFEQDYKHAWEFKGNSEISIFLKPFRSMLLIEPTGCFICS